MGLSLEAKHPHIPPLARAASRGANQASQNNKSCRQCKLHSLLLLNDVAARLSRITCPATLSPIDNRAIRLGDSPPRKRGTWREAD